MPCRTLVMKELADLLAVLSHPVRLRIVEEIHTAHELDVNSLQQLLRISHSGVSQHLAVLRSHRVVIERRQGKTVFYHLRQPELATWLIDGLDFIAPSEAEIEELRSAVERVRTLYPKNIEQAQ